MEKKPTECKNSMLFGDVYICKLQTVPCAVLDKCALDVVDSLAETMTALVNLMKEQQKEDA